MGAYQDLNFSFSALKLLVKKNRSRLNDDINNNNNKQIEGGRINEKRMISQLCCNSDY